MLDDSDSIEMPGMMRVLFESLHLTGPLSKMWLGFMIPNPHASYDDSTRLFYLYNIWFRRQIQQSMTRAAEPEALDLGPFPRARAGLRFHNRRLAQGGDNCEIRQPDRSSCLIQKAKHVGVEP